MSLSLAARRAELLTVRGLIDAGGGGALWLFTDASMPPSPESAAGAAPSAVVPLGLVSFELHETEASMTCSAVGNASSSGQVTWARFVDGLGVGVLDRTAGPPGSGAQIIVSDGAAVPTAQIWAGGELTVSHTLTNNA